MDQPFGCIPNEMAGWPELVEHMCGAISRTRWHPDLLTTALVFQAGATSDVDADSGEVGVRIETNMEDFRCRQCGACCRYLDYHNEVTAEDVAFWKASGQSDILKWVDEVNRDGHTKRYRAWVIPGTRKETDTCPFLEKEPDSRRWRCRIHNVKPAICRQYPLNRKHAIMSGCRGFDKKITS
jgi:Fe-S-cluster containining protein